MLGRAGLMQVRQVGPARNRCACASLSRAASHTSGASPFVLSRRAVRVVERAVRTSFARTYYRTKSKNFPGLWAGFTAHPRGHSRGPFGLCVFRPHYISTREIKTWNQTSKLGRGSVQFDGAPSVPVDRAQDTMPFTIHRAVGTCSTSSPRRQRLETLRAPAISKSAWLECRRPGVPPLRLAKRLARPLATSA
jgi:hypothetical protein